MKYFFLILKFLVLAYLCSLVYFFLTTDGPAAPGYRPPVVLWMLDTINLFIHEAGHFFLKPFGKWIYLFGGSFVQCLLPLLLTLVVARQGIANAHYPAFWFGENLINVSYYIQDAPFKKLKLIARGLIHDWNWLLAGNFEYAEPLGTMAKSIGLLVCASSLIVGAWFAVKAFREEPVTPE